MENKMFCYQCQETAGCKGCTITGVCGKTPRTAAMQDLLVYVTKGFCAVTSRLRELGIPVASSVNKHISENLFATITNANFDEDAIVERIRQTLIEKESLLANLPSKEGLPDAALWNGAEETFSEKAAKVGILSTEQEDIRSLRELITYGIQGRMHGKDMRTVL